jgi:transposase
MEKITVGIDVSKDRLDVTVRPSGERFAVPRTGAGLDDLVARLKVMKPNLIVLEATGGFETVVVAALAGAGLPVAVANPAQIRAFAKAIGQRAKTDPIDAGVIAHFGEATGITPRPLPDPRHPAACRSCRPPAPDHRHDRIRRAARETRQSPHQEEHRQAREGARA